MRKDIGTVEFLGKVMYTTYLFPFEITSLSAAGGDCRRSHARKKEDTRMIPIEYYLLLSAFMFCAGVVGVLVRRNAIVVFMCIELMLNSVNLTLITFSAYFGDPGGQILVSL